MNILLVLYSYQVMLLYFIASFLISLVTSSHSEMIIPAPSLVEEQVNSEAFVSPNPDVIEYPIDQPTAIPVVFSTPTATPTHVPITTPTPLLVISPTKTSKSFFYPTAGPTLRSKSPTSTSDFNCDCSKTCPNLSCAEAQYQLNVCGCSQRDGDDDGTACDADCQ